jgi:hypothetical protein
MFDVILVFRLVAPASREGQLTGNQISTPAVPSWPIVDSYGEALVTDIRSFRFVISEPMAHCLPGIHCD